MSPGLDGALPKNGLHYVGNSDSKNVHYFRSRLLEELKRYSTNIYPSPAELLSWPKIAVERWEFVNRPKATDELAVLSWNTNGRLNFRGCRENLLRRWALGGFVDVALIQEHFKDENSPLFNLFGSGWRNFSSGAVGNDCGRKSGGCAIFVQPCVSSGVGFQYPGGRICALYISGGILLNVYFPTKEQRQSTAKYREMFHAFILELWNIVKKAVCKSPVSWIVCGADLNAHFAGSGIPPRRSDDYAASCIRKFMKRFNLISMAEEVCPDRFTYINSRGATSCLDSFLVSRHLYQGGKVTMYEVVDFIEHGSDHCPVYIRLKVHPRWRKRPVGSVRRIMKNSGLESLRKKLDEGSIHRPKVVTKILSFFANLKWSEVKTRKGMDELWSLWVKKYNLMVETLIGTRPAKVAS